MEETAGSYTAPAGQDEVVAALRAGDEATFAALVDELGPSMLRVAMMYTPSRAVAEDVVSEAWLGVLAGIGRFEGRSSLKTWIFRILTNRAKTRGERESRSIPFSSLAAADAEGDEHAVDPDRFVADGAWRSAPATFSALPEARLIGKETLQVAQEAIDALPAMQRSVITLRDVEGWSSEDVRNVLDLSESNQRVLLHRARSKVRQALETYLEGEGT